MLRTLEEFHQDAKEIADWKTGFLGFDYETNGLQVRAGARAFILGYAWRGPSGERISNSVLLDDPRAGEVVRLLLSNRRIKYGAHNAKFELSFNRHQFQAEIAGDVWCTEAMARVQHNNHFPRVYSLAACARRLGLEKYAPMMEWLKKHKRQGLMHHNAPLELTVPYVEQDAWLEVPLYEDQKASFVEWQKSSVPIWKVVELEMQMTKDLFEMEDAGFEVDVNYCMEALNYEAKREKAAAERFTEITGAYPTMSAKNLQPIFDAHNIPYGRTAPSKRFPQGQASFSAEFLEKSKGNPIVDSLLEIAQAHKRVASYWENFIDLQVQGKIYPSISQNEARTGRMSIRDPSVQNWATDEDDPQYPIRRAFTCDDDHVIASLDFKGMELALMCDEAGDVKMAQAMRDGTDFHQEVASFAGVLRSLAKNGRFAKLYGAGVPRVAATLGIDLETARRLCRALDKASPEINAYCKGLIGFAKTAPFGFDWMGRRFFLDSGKEYKLPNYRIQGGCGEILKIAIRDITPYIKANRTSPTTALIAPIHDELVLRLAKRDLFMLPEIKKLMIAAHRNRKILDMDVSIAVGPNFHDLEAYVPAVAESLACV